MVSVMRKLIVLELLILLVGTVFAWTNFAIELISWINHVPCTSGCGFSVVSPINPFSTPCFYGALFFSLAFILIVIIFVKRQKLLFES